MSAKTLELKHLTIHSMDSLSLQIEQRTHAPQDPFDGFFSSVLVRGGEPKEEFSSSFCWTGAASH